MPRTNTARRWSLLPLLLLLALGGAWAGVSAASADGCSVLAVERACGTPSGEGEERAASAYEHGYAALRLAEQPAQAAAKSAGDGSSGEGRQDSKVLSALASAVFTGHTALSKAALKQRLCLLYSRGETEQRLALYPKHGFW